MKELFYLLIHIEWARLWRIIPAVLIQAAGLICLSILTIDVFWLSLILGIILCTQISIYWTGGILFGLIFSVASSFTCFLGITYNPLLLGTNLGFIFIAVGISIIWFRVRTELKLNKNKDETLDVMVELVNLRDMVSRIGELQNQIYGTQEKVEQNLLEIRAIVNAYAEKVDGLFFSSLRITPKVENTHEELLQLIESINQIKSATGTQADLVAKNTQSQENMYINLRDLKEKVGAAYRINKDLNSLAEEGKEKINQAFTSIKELSVYQSDSLAIVKMISDVVEKTNVLAINASIEAIHAGKAGNGFSVVAKEVRKLADEAKKRANEISMTIQSMNEKLGYSIKVVLGVGVSIEQILKGISDVYPVIRDISTIMESLMTGDARVRGLIDRLRESMEGISNNTIKEKEIVENYRNTFKSLKSYFELLAHTIDDLKDHNQKSEDLLNTVKEIQDENSRLSSNIQDLLVCSNKSD